jgi:hypothetical protein
MLAHSLASVAWHDEVSHAPLLYCEHLKLLFDTSLQVATSLEFSVGQVHVPLDASVAEQCASAPFNAGIHVHEVPPALY